MSYVSDVFTKSAVLVPKKSGFNLDSEHLFTCKCGTLCPVFCLETLPNSDYNVGANFNVKLPPLASDFYGKVDAIIELFWISNRGLYGGWEEFAVLPKLHGAGSVDYSLEDDGRVVSRGSGASPVDYNAQSEKYNDSNSQADSYTGVVVHNGCS